MELQLQPEGDSQTGSQSLLPPIAQEESPYINTGKKEKQEEEDDDDMEGDEEKADQPQSRQDLYVCFTNDKDLRHHETISIKAALYKGIAIKVKILNHIWIENILFSIESAPDLGIINLRFEECRLLKKAVQRLIEFCKSTNIIESLSLFKTTFDDGQDFKRLVEAVSFNNKIKQFSVQSADFDEDYHGKTMSRCILESRSLKELDLSYVTFEDPKSFYEMANGLLNERCRLGALKLRGIAFGQLEGKVMQFILMRNKSLQTLDISQCSTDSPENLENVFCKFDSFCNLRTLIAENLNADFNYVVEIFGEAIGGNTKMEGLSIKENKLKQTQYCNFWELMQENRSLKKMNVSKTEITDKVCAKISQYLQQPELKLHDLNLSRNSIAADGLVCIAEALMENTSLITLNLAQNLIREGGIPEFVQALKKNNSIQELCLSFNKINNAGMSSLAGFLEDNKSIKVLDVSRNTFSDSGFCDFAKQLAKNKGIESLNLSKNKDVTDEVGLKELAHALAFNSSLAVIDLTSLKVRKPCVLQYFQPALKSNITLKRIIGKIPPGIIGEDLKDNVTIEAEIQSKYRTIKKDQRRELRKLPLHRIDGDQTQLNLRDQPNELLTPALKFIRYRRIHAVDLSNMQLEDESLRLLALYLEENPVLRSLALAENLFTDDGLAQIIVALKKNTNLNHLNIISCVNISDQSLRALEDMVTKVNMSLYAIEIDLEKFDPDLIDSILDQAAMNRAIQEHLKPRKVIKDGLAEIQFQKDAAIAKYFDSAIKAWRIMMPSFIRVVAEGLEDEHVQKLCAFLSGRNLIQSLNLRRNKIGDKGAIAIAEYIRNSDKTLTSLELERNLIEDEGGEALLKAMQANMRMECCKMAYGNPLRQKICRQIEREIKANLQIKQTVVPRYKQNNNSLTSYEESDRGPDFVRCALKSCELFKILHLSLPDNMIGEKEMIDIAYVISRNTPLKTLNLSDNAVDAKSAVILAEALGNNSNLKDLDLRNNKLQDGGIAILMEPFISQILSREKMIEDLKRGVNQSADYIENNDSQEPKQEYRQLKMKIQKLSLDKNQQTNEALKHIYTVLIGNKDIEISIDLPDDRRHTDLKDDDDSGSDDFESDRLLSPRNAVVPINPAIKSEQSEVEDPDDQLSPKGNLSDSEMNILDKKARGEKNIPGICRPRFCKPCRLLCFKAKGAQSLSCAEIMFPSFFAAKVQATQFKISWEFVQIGEQKVQKQIFAMLVSILFFYFVLAIVFPFLIPPTPEIKCTSMLPIVVFAGYGGFIGISYLVELLIYFSIKSNLKLENGQSTLSCNSYLFAKQLQGTLSNLDTYVHICYIASVRQCHAESLEDAQEKSSSLEGFNIFLAIVATISLIVSNIRRVKFIWDYKSPQPDIHRLLPNTFRNIQFAWITNLNAIAVILESTSLSEFMIDNGGTIVPGKEKYVGDQKKQQVLSISDLLLQDKMKYQDLPMVCILVLAFLIQLFSGSFDLVTICFISVTALSLFCNYLTLQSKRDQKGVDSSTVIHLIRTRMEAADQKREAEAPATKEVPEKPHIKVMQTQDSGQETDKSLEKIMGNGDEFSQEDENQQSKKQLLEKEEDDESKLEIENEDKQLPQGSINNSAEVLAGTQSVPLAGENENVKTGDLDLSISKINLKVQK